MGLMYPKHVLASHVNMIRCQPPTFNSHPILAFQHLFFPFSEREKEGLERSRWFDKYGSAYRSLQSTKPQTLGFALQDSPVALLAWIYEVCRRELRLVQKAKSSVTRNCTTGQMPTLVRNPHLESRTLDFRAFDSLDQVVVESPQYFSPAYCH